MGICDIQICNHPCELFFDVASKMMGGKNLCCHICPCYRQLALLPCVLPTSGPSNLVFSVSPHHICHICTLLLVLFQPQDLCEMWRHHQKGPEKIQEGQKCQELAVQKDHGEVMFFLLNFGNTGGPSLKVLEGALPKLFK